MRTARDYVEALRDGRRVLVDGKAVDDVTTHPAFAAVVQTVGRLYDIAADSASRMRADDSGVGLIYSIPRSVGDLAARRAAITRWARETGGFLGRSPDHVAGFFAGFASAPSVFDDGEHTYGQNVVAFQQRMAAEDLFVSYTIIPPQSAEQVALIAERDNGIVVRGAQILGTATAISDHLFVSCIRPLAPDDRRHALSFAVPVATAGLTVHCRRPYAPGAPSPFDYPLTATADESDAVVTFDDVLVPWQNVFVCGDPARVRSQFFATAAHALGNTQAQIRFVTKLQFLLGAIHLLTEQNGTAALPAVQERLGELAALAGQVEACVIAAEATAQLDAHGVMVPNRRFLYAQMGLQAETYPRILHIMRELAGSSVLQAPSSDAALGVDTALTPWDGPGAVERVQLDKLVWDLIGSEFAGRHQQYEMFYAGAPFVAKGHAYRNYGYDAVAADVRDFLQAYRPA
jgi:4-hydroxyphenylacetate 3-monooxygenase